MTPAPLVLAAAGAAGLVLGSFAVTAGMRMARSEGVLVGRSHCDGCGRILGFAETIPLLSFAAARGRCGACGSEIARLHLAGEGLGAVVAVASCLWLAPARAAPVAAIGLLLIAAAAADLRAYRLPDLITAAVAGLAASLALGESRAAFWEGAIASLVALAVLQGLRAFRSAGGRDPGIGLGDVKLIAALALWLGAATPLAVAAAAGLGLAWTAAGRRPRDAKLAFGPAIAVAGWTLGLAREGGLWPATA